MKRHLIWVLALVFIFSLNSAQAADLAGKWSLAASGGIGITLSPDELSDALPYAFALSGDLAYMFTENIGFVPGSFTFHKFSVDEEKVFDYVDIPGGLSIDLSAWGFAYTPGVLFTSSGESKVRGFGQVGLGIYHFKASAEEKTTGIKADESVNNFGMLFGGGIEVDVSDRAAFVGKVRYLLITPWDDSTSLLDFTAGIKFYFGD